MALPLELFFTVQDEKGETSTVTIPVQSTLSMLDIPHAIRAVGNLIDPMINGAIVSAGAQVNFDVSTTAWETLVQVGADIQEGARFVARSAEGFLKSLRLPTFSESLLTADGEVDVTDTDVAAFMTGMLGGVDLSGIGGTGSCELVTAHDEDLTAWVSSKEHFTKSRG